MEMKWLCFQLFFEVLNLPLLSQLSQLFKPLYSTISFCGLVVKFIKN